jgi:phage gpG-like protein
MITVELIGKDQVVLRLSRMSAQIRASLLRAVSAEAIRVEARVKQKLTGAVLKERTHHLHDSIHHQIADDANGVTATVGTDVVYAAYHEYGFSGVEQVRQHLRRVIQAFGKPIAPVEATVRAHARHVHYPARSFLRSTLAEMEGDIRERLAAAVGQAVKP